METTTQKERELELENIRLKEELKRALERNKYFVDIYTAIPLQSCGNHVEFGHSQIVSEVFGCGFTDDDWHYVKKGDYQLHYRITVERIEE